MKKKIFILLLMHLNFMLFAIENPINFSGNNFPLAIGIVKNNKLICSGTIINPEVVLTSAHCLFSNNQEDVFAVYWGNGQEKIDFGSDHFIIIKHSETFPGWNFKNKKQKNNGSDLALALLEKPILDAPKVKFLDPENSIYLVLNNPLLYVGFGAKSLDEELIEGTVGEKLVGISHNALIEDRFIKLKKNEANSFLISGDSGAGIYLLVPNSKDNSIELKLCAVHMGRVEGSDFSYESRLTSEFYNWLEDFFKRNNL